MPTLQKRSNNGLRVRSRARRWPTCVDGEGNPTGFKANPWQSFAVLYDVQMLPEDHPTPEPFLKSMARPRAGNEPTRRLQDARKE